MANSAALAKIDDAFRRFKDTVSSKDAYQFRDTNLKDVRDAAKDIEKQLATKGESRGLRWIAPLLNGLDHYSKAVEILCNGTPYLPWIWVLLYLTLSQIILLIDVKAPIKLFLQV